MTILLISFIALTVQEFNSVLSLVGSLTCNFLAVILPVLIYIKLWKKNNVPVKLYEKVFIIEIVILSIVCLILGTIASVQKIYEIVIFQPPCYVFW